MREFRLQFLQVLAQHFAARALLEKMINHHYDDGKLIKKVLRAFFSILLVRCCATHELTN